MNRAVVKNFFYAFGAHVVSLSASLAITFIASGLLGVKEFAYWQLFLTYVTYVNISRFGVNDGLYLRLGGKDYANLDYSLLSHERQVFIGIQCVIAITLAIVVCCIDMDPNRRFVLLACCACIIIVNANGFIIYILQAVNLTRIYSVSVVLQNLPWFVAVIIIAIFKIYSFKVIVICYMAGHVCGGVYLAFHAKEIVRHKRTNRTLVFQDIKENISCGIKLMIATYAGSFIIASARIIVDAAWGVEIFGYLSFSLTLANVFLQFVNQTSIVVFPALRKVSEKNQKSVYYLLRSALGLILPAVMLGYLPIVILVNIFLPQYRPSLEYLPIFLPICTFDGKMQMMCSSFFKSMRKEGMLLMINVATLVLSIVTALFGALFVKNIYFVSIGILVVVALRSIISELILAKYMEADIRWELLQEILLVILFVSGCMLFNSYIMFVVYAIAYMLYLMANRKRASDLLQLRKMK
ncbi:MAG: hypothetical protein LUD07_12205 [Clostridiales bacterium]|nr:hypothetical protein [Clostridiales bacterium]